MHQPDSGAASRWLLLLLGLGLASGVQAQAVTPGQIVDTLKPQPTLQPPQPPTRVPDLPRPTPAPRSAGEGRQITVQRFEFDGNTLFDSNTLGALLREFVDRPVSLLDLYTAADRVATFYVERGYALASVNLPPQKITDGTVLLQVSEGRIGRIDVAGTRHYQAEHVRSYLHDVRENGIYRSADLQDGLRTLNTLPGLSARATVRPGQIAETSDITVALDETLLQGSLTLDNFGRQGVGEYRLSAAAVLNNPLSVEDQLQLIGLVSEDALTRYGAFTYSVPLNFSGTRARFSYGDARFEVEGSPVEGRSRSGDFTLEHPLLNDARQRLTAGFGPSRSLSNADFSGLTFNETSITLWKLALAYSRNYSNASVTQIGSVLSSSFDSLPEGELSALRVRGEQSFKWELDLQHLAQLGRAFQLLIRASGTWSPDPLVDTQKYSLGGPTSVRGYPSAELRGDQGYFGSLTLQHTAPLRLLTLRSRIFVDAGRVFAVDAPDAGSLSSAGVGFDLLARPLAFRLDWAVPLDNRDVSDGHDSGRAFGALSASF